MGAMGQNLFTYGTLSVPEVMTALIGRTFESSEAQADGYTCFLIKGEHYPGIVARAGHSARGRVHFDVDEETWSVLDRFEGDVYSRQSIEVKTSGQPVSALTYVILPWRAEVLSETPWDEAAFLAEHGKAYIDMCRKFGRRIRA